ncbi:MAG: DUF1566 domain-containing protein [Campylobacterota bacterium]|nr:DUF1566 domain-containing protein [Campylobacterota bacterium]
MVVKRILWNKVEIELPTIEELETIVIKEKINDFHIKAPLSNNNTSSNAYWSSTAYEGNSDGAWVVYFRSGDMFDGYKDYSGHVRCVTDGQ